MTDRFFRSRNIFAASFVLLFTVTGTAYPEAVRNQSVKPQYLGQTYPGFIELSFPAPDVCFNPTGLAQNEGFLWVADRNGWLFKIDPADGRILAQIDSLSLNISGLSWDPFFQTLLCTTGVSGNIYRIDTGNGALESVFTASGSTVLQDLVHDGSSAIFCIDKTHEKIIKINAFTYEEVKSISVSPLDLKSLTWDGRYLWAADGQEKKLHLIDFEKDLVVSSLLTPGDDPYGTASDTSGAALWHVDGTEKRIYKILVRNAETSFSRDTPFGARLQYIDEIRNNGPNILSSLKTFFAVPRTTGHQTFFSPLTYDGLHGFNDGFYDQYGQQVAYAREILDVGASTSPGYTAEILNFNLRYFLYPEDVGDEEFPQDIKDLYVTGSFPPDSDKYDVDDPLIQNAALEATAGASNLYWKYRRINDYVGSRLYYNNDSQWDDAPVVLQNGHGSCSEYSILFIALCRAAGLPARYQGGSRPRDTFPYIDDVFHRWVEVYFPNIGWVPVDPTWNDPGDETPPKAAPYFGLLINSLFITTTGGGFSSGPDPDGGQGLVKYLNWNYNCYNSWSSSSDVDIDRRFVWNAPSERRLVYLAMTPENPVVRLERGIEYMKAVGYYNDQTQEDMTEKVTWTSSDDFTGSVNGYGYLVCYAEGTITVAASHQESGLSCSTRVVITGQIPDLRTLTISCSGGGTTSPAPGSYAHSSGARVNILAVPETHYIFTGWSGDVHQSREKDNPLSVVMDWDRSLAASFIRLIYAPLNFSGRKVVNRSLSQSEYINILTWQANPDNENITKYRLCSIENGSRTLLAELDSGTFTYMVRNAAKDRQYVYAISAVNDEGREGSSDSITIK